MMKTEVLHVSQDRRLEETRLRLPKACRACPQSSIQVCLDQGSARGRISAHDASLLAGASMYHFPWKSTRITTGWLVLFCGHSYNGTEKRPREGIQLGGMGVLCWQPGCQAVPEVRCANAQNDTR